MDEIIAEVPLVYSPQLDAPSILNHFLHTNSNAPRRASVAVWADQKLMQMVSTIQRRQSVIPGNRMNEIVAVSEESLESIASIQWSQEEALDAWDFGELSCLPPKAIKRILQYCSMESIARLMQTGSTFKQFIGHLIQGEVLNDIYSNIDLSQRNKGITDTSITSIIHFCGAHVQHLNLKNCWSLTDIGITAITSHVFSVVSLNLSSLWDITDTSLKSIAQHITSLQKIDLSNCRKITDSGLISLLSCTYLVDISLSYCKSITSAAFIHPQWQQMKRLNIQRCTNIRDAAFTAWLAAYQITGKKYAMQQLILDDCSFLTDEAVACIMAVCDGIQVLSLSFCCSLSPGACGSIVNEGHVLRVLDLSFCGCAVVDDSVECVMRGCPELEWVNIRGCSQVTEGCLGAFAEHDKLRVANLSQCKGLVSIKDIEGVRLVNDFEWGREEELEG